MAGVEVAPETAQSVAKPDGSSSSRRPPLAQRRQVGRYSYSATGPKADTRTPPDGVGRLPHPAQRHETLLGAVDDPWRDSHDAASKRIEVAINSKVDLLEAERSRKLLSEAAYRTGRLIQAVFERTGRQSSTNWAGATRADPILVQEAKVVRGVDAARAIMALERRIRERLGMIDTRLLRRILGDRLSYAECACLQGKSGDRGERYVAMRFREALENVAEAFGAKNTPRPVPEDPHDAASATDWGADWLGSQV